MKAFLSYIVVAQFLVFSTFAQEAKTDLEGWREKVVAQPNNALAHFNLGVNYHKGKQWQSALDEYNKVIELKSSLAPVANYYKAMIYNTLGKKSEARSALTQIPLDRVPSTLRSSVLELKNKLFAETLAAEDLGLEINSEPSAAVTAAPEKKGYVFLDLSAGYNSNPALVLDTSTTGQKADSTQGVRAGGSYLLIASGTMEFRANYFFALTAFSKDTDYNYYYQQFSLPFAYYFDSVRVKISPDYFVDNYGGKSYSESSGGSLDVAKKIGGNYWGLSLQTSTIKNKTATYSYLTGTQQRVQIYNERQWVDSKLLLSAGYGRLNYQDTTTLTSSYSAGSLGLAYTKYYEKIETSFSAGAEVKTYGRASGQTMSRLDNRLYFDVRLGYAFSRNFQIYTDAMVVQNTSNFNTSTTGDYNYKQLLWVVGLTIGY